MNEPMVKTGAAMAELGTQEFFDRARARLRFDIPPGLTDASIVPLTGADSRSDATEPRKAVS